MNRKQRRAQARQNLRDARKRAAEGKPFVRITDSGVAIPTGASDVVGYHNALHDLSAYSDAVEEMAKRHGIMDEPGAPEAFANARKIDVPLRNEDPTRIEVDVVYHGEGQHRAFVKSTGRLGEITDELMDLAAKRGKTSDERERLERVKDASDGRVLQNGVDLPASWLASASDVGPGPRARVGRSLEDSVLVDDPERVALLRHSTTLASVTDPLRKSPNLFPDADMRIQRDFFTCGALRDLFQRDRPEAKVFHLSLAQYAALNHENPFTLGIDEVFFIPPFPLYYMKVDKNPMRPLLPESETVDKEGGRIKGRLDGMLVNTSQPDRWLIAEHVEYENDARNPATNASTTIGIAFEPSTGRLAVIGENPQDIAKLPTDEMKSVTGTALQLLWTAVNFMLLINSKEVEHVLVTDPLRPPTRQQRRAQGYIDAPHYEIRLKPKQTIRTALEQAVREHRKHYKRPHDVRSHPRRYKSGRVAVVRAHRRGLRGEKPEIKREYDAKEMGTAVRKAPFEV
jgi:hypothetical protein